MGDEIPTNEKIREAMIQIMIGRREEANRLLKIAVVETRAKRLLLQARREARRERGGIPLHPKD